MQIFVQFIILNYKSILLTLFYLYIFTALLKLIFYTFKIRYGKSLKHQITVTSHKNKLSKKEYALTKEYCKKADILVKLTPYNVPDSFVNIQNRKIQQQLISYLDEAIGIYSSRRRYCYILLPVHKNNKSGATLKVFIDAVIKIATAAIIELLKSVIAN